MNAPNPTLLFASTFSPTCPEILCKNDDMKRIDVDYFYTLGRAMSLLEECFALVPCDIASRDWSRIYNSIEWLKPIARGEYKTIHSMQPLANDLLNILVPLLGAKETVIRIDSLLQTRIHQKLTEFHNAMRIRASEIHTFFIPGVGAYSASSLMEDATCHLSDEAQKEMEESEKTDFIFAGRCLACTLYTATGFHAMRALEAEARRYHMAVIGGHKEVDWTLDPLINGNSGRSQVGLRDQWKKENAKPDSPLALIISLLSSINQIYRNPIMHPEMTLDKATAKEVFDTAALTISRMVHDRLERKASNGIKP